MPMFPFQQDLTQYLLSRGLIDEILPTTPDIADKWQQIAEAYLPDGIREFALYPTAALGWMMYIGMAIAKYGSVVKPSCNPSPLMHIIS